MMFPFYKSFAAVMQGAIFALCALCASAEDAKGAASPVHMPALKATDVTPDVTTNLAAIAEQRLSIEAAQKLVLDQFQLDSKACWQRFAVNDCLAKARQLKYQQLAPLDQREVQLNALQRDLKERERQQRLMDKAPSKASS